MSTPVTVTAFGNWFVFSNSWFLAKAGKGIKFPQNGDDWALVTSFTDDGCWHAADILCNSKSLCFEHGHMFLHRPEFFVKRFRRIKNPVR